MLFVQKIKPFNVLCSYFFKLQSLYVLILSCSCRKKECIPYFFHFCPKLKFVLEGYRAVSRVQNASQAQLSGCCPSKFSLVDGSRQLGDVLLWGSRHALICDQGVNPPTTRGINTCTFTVSGVDSLYLGTQRNTTNYTSVC